MEIKMIFHHVMKMSIFSDIFVLWIIEDSMWRLYCSLSIGPRLFLSCPMEISGSKVWFTDLWNYSIVPYLLEAVREGLQVCCKTLNLIYWKYMKVSSCISTQYYTGDISFIDISLKELLNNIFVPTCFWSEQYKLFNNISLLSYFCRSTAREPHGKTPQTGSWSHIPGQRPRTRTPPCWRSALRM